MSFLSELDKHDKNPGDHWGPYSCRSRKEKSNETDCPENDDVCLISTSPNINRRSLRRSLTRNPKQQNSATNPIEIKEDCSDRNNAPQSTTDRKPGEFHVDGSNFIIPKRKTERGRAGNLCESTTTGGDWLNTTKERLCSRQKINAKQNGMKSSPNLVKINRSWLHATSPKKSGENSSPDGLKKIKDCYSEPDGSESDQSVCNGELKITKQRFPNAYKYQQPKCNISTDDSTMAVENENCAGMQNSETSEICHDPVNQDDIFCNMCGGPKDKNGCRTCSEQDKNSGNVFLTTDVFYNSTLSSVKKGAYSGRKSCGKNNSSQLQTKRKKQRRNKETPPSNQRQIDSSGEFRLSDKKPGRKRKSNGTPEPELVHISSDEEDRGKREASSVDAPQLDSVANKLSKNCEKDCHDVDEVRQDDQSCADVQDSTQNLSIPMETEHEILPKAEDISESKNTKRNSKDKKSRTTENDIYQRDDITVKLVVNEIYVGRVKGTATEPVEITAENIKIQLLHEKEKRVFRLQGIDIQSFQINNANSPLIVVIIPTPGWARKMNERYNFKDMPHFIDPGSAAYDERQIMLILSEKLDRLVLADLVELINDGLSGTRVFETISSDRAKTMVKKLSSSISNSSNGSHSSVKRSAQSSSSHVSSYSYPAPVKTYNTRSKHGTDTSQHVCKRPVEKILVYPPLSKTGGVTITTEDMECLNPDTYLNDVIIDFFLKYLVEEVLSAEDKKRIHIFSSFFYKRLTLKKQNLDKGQRTPESMHSLVKTWTKNVDIFSKDFLIVPINESSHWYLSIICYPGLVAQLLYGNEEKEASDASPSPEILQISTDNLFSDTDGPQSESKGDGSDDEAFDRPLNQTTRKRIKKKKSCEKVPIKSRPCILTFDSLGISHRAQMLVNLRNYLTCEWRERKGNGDNMPLTFNKDTLKACFPKVPLQNNSSDCGLYILQYVESFFKNPIKDYNFPISIPNWFSLEVIEEKRESLKNLIYKLKERIDIDDSS